MLHVLGFEGALFGLICPRQSFVEIETAVEDRRAQDQPPADRFHQLQHRRTVQFSVVVPGPFLKPLLRYFYNIFIDFVSRQSHTWIGKQHVSAQVHIRKRALLLHEWNEGEWKVEFTNPPTKRPPMVPWDVIEATARRDRMDQSSLVCGNITEVFPDRLAIWRGI